MEFYGVALHNSNGVVDNSIDSQGRVCDVLSCPVYVRRRNSCVGRIMDEEGL